MEEVTEPLGTQVTLGARKDRARGHKKITLRATIDLAR